MNHESRIGEVHGVFTIVEVMPERDNSHHVIYKGVCNVCGFVTYTKYHNFCAMSKNNRGCKHTIIGGQYISNKPWKSSRVARIFSKMKARCYSPDSPDYRWYGAKGIKIYQEWLDDPRSFESWAFDNGYQDGLSIDRIDTDKDYEPSNCRWISLADNAKYKSSSRRIEVDGEIHTGREWARVLGLGVNSINKYIRMYGESNVVEFIRQYRLNPPQNKLDNINYYRLYMSNFATHKTPDN